MVDGAMFLRFTLMYARLNVRRRRGLHEIIVVMIRGFYNRGDGRRPPSLGG